MLDSDIRSSESLNVLKFIRTKANSFFNCLNPKRVKLITRLRLGLSHYEIISSNIPEPYMKLWY